MAASLFGECLTKKDGSTVSPALAIQSASYVGIYFSASWCGPCKSFTPQLCKFYEQHAALKKFEIVFASLDKTPESFSEYFSEMSWPYAIPHGSELIKKLSAKYKVQGIPTLVLLDATGALITVDGREGVGDDADGSAFPYRPRTVWELLGDAGNVVDAKDKSYDVSTLRALDGIGLYFSAHWCPPCRGFTPQLAKWYEAHVGPGGALAGKVDIVFVSSDRSQGEFDEYRREMPWKSLPTPGGKVKAALSSLFKVEGIPTLVFIDREGQVLTSSGREKVLSEPEGFPWPAPPVTTLDAAASDFINDVPTAVLFTDKLTDAAAEEAAVASFTAVAQVVFKANGGAVHPGLRFAIARESDDAVQPVRKFLGPAYLKDKDGPSALRLTIIDITEGKKYQWNDGEPGSLSQTDVQSFVDAFLSGTLEGIPARS